jgi:UDP-N-acetylglucosamine 1-carboxyvinyltransferase
MLKTLWIEGGEPLTGEFQVSSAKNAVLPILASTLLSDQPITLLEVPRLRDIEVLLELLATLGTRFAWEGSTLYLHTPQIVSVDAAYELVSQLRASFVVLGALLARVGEARMPMPGGCAFGPRPVDLHIKALRALGAEISEDAGAFQAQRSQPFTGRVVFDIPTVGGTEQVILAAALGEGEVIVVNAAQEPEIIDLANFLNGLGAQIQGAGTSMLVIRGVKNLGGGSYRVIPDRIEAGTFLLAAAATRGNLLVSKVNPYHLDSLLAKFRESGHHLETGPDWIRLNAAAQPNPLVIEAREYPGFPTDLQPPMTAYLATVPGVSLVSDRVYPERTTHIGELSRMGADLTLKDRVIAINGGSLSGATVRAFDLRAAGALLVAALAATGQTRLENAHHLERGYANLEARLKALGVNIASSLGLGELAAD